MDVEGPRFSKALIALDPKNRWSHGNYGAFLFDRQRYDEAIVEYEKAVALGSYPAAQEDLERARRRRDAARSRR